MLDSARALTVSELTDAVKRAIEQAPALYDTVVVGEISNFVHHGSGHMYFTLKDRDCAIKCVMFRNWNQRLLFTPSDGDKVYLRGDVTVYKRGGNYQLNVFSMEPAGQGALALAFAQLKNKLEAEGLFARERKQSIPAFPARIGLITAPGSAALQDFLTTASGQGWPLTTLLAPALMQGLGGASSVITALNNLSRLELDVIVITRGGGSLEELSVFNEEAVARAVAACPIPVVSAIGHETDYTICDFAADVRAATPTAAAKLVVPERAAVLQQMAGFDQRLRQAIQGRLTAVHSDFSRLRSRPILTRPWQLLLQPRQNLDYTAYKLQTILQNLLDARRNRLSALNNRLEDLNPRNVLRRGYSLIRTETDIINSVCQLRPGQDITIQLQDGSARALVQAVEGSKADGSKGET
ncbi:MAG: exodeoxyribonuclease VII large subunit [Firmicutes bacterium]|nr:exodeoxyribonuclease VII large subunit [Bacillota bacterium]